MISTAPEPAKDSQSNFHFSRPAIFTGLVLAILIVLSFFPVLQAELVHWDDDINIFSNPHIQQLNWKTVKWMFSDVQYTPRYRPLNWLAWATIIHFFGLKGPAFHAYLLILHVANALLIFHLLKKIVRRVLPIDSQSWSTNILLGLSTAIWALHPLRVEVVGWANCVIYAQSLFFLLLSLLFYFRTAEKNKTALRKNDFWLSLIFFAFSLLTYPTALGWVVVLLVLDIFLLRRLTFSEKWSSPNRRVLFEKIPFALLTLVIGTATLWARATMSGIWTGMSDLRDFSWPARIMQAFYVWAYYLWKTWLPFSLSPVYTRLVSFKPAEPIFLISAALVIGLTIFLFFKRRRYPLLLALWICHLVLLIPMLGLTEHPHYTNDRYSYIVGILWSVSLAFALLHFSEKIKVQLPLRIGCFAAAFIFAGMSFQQTKLWQNSETLFQGTIVRLGSDPYRCDVQWRYGRFLAEKGNSNGALDAFSQALSSNPQMIRARYDLAGVLAQQKKFDEAAMQYREVIRSNPKFADANYNLGIVLSQLGQREEAAKFFAAAVETSPENPDAHFQFGNVLAMSGKMKEALARFSEAVRLKPDFVPALLNLSRAHAELREWNDAIEAARKALKLAVGDKNLSQQLEQAISSYETLRQQSSP